MAGTVVAIFGPTASGKSAVAEALVDRVGGDPISCDAMQAYRGLPILTNQPERQTLLVGVWPLAHEGSVGEYAALAHPAIDAVVAAKGCAVVAGGTGLYLRAAVADLDLPPAPDPAERARAEALYARLGPERAHAVLAERDPYAAEAVHANDRRRVVRALELQALGLSLRNPTDRLWSDVSRHPTVVVGLDVPRETVAARIETRAAAMWERGAVAEARQALAGPLSVQARAAIGLSEVEANLSALEAIASVAARTRRYAAYQRKWMRRIPGIVMIDADRRAEEVADAILEVGRARERVSAR